jgi:hypothetical protein
MLNIRPENKRLRVRLEEAPPSHSGGSSLLYLPEKEEYLVAVVEAQANDCIVSRSTNSERVIFQKRFLETISVAGERHNFVLEEHVAASWCSE